MMLFGVKHIAFFREINFTKNLLKTKEKLSQQVCFVLSKIFRKIIIHTCVDLKGFF